MNHENTVALRGVSESRLFTHVAKRGDALWSRGERNLLKTSRLVFPNFMMLLKWPRGERDLLKNLEAGFSIFMMLLEFSPVTLLELCVMSFYTVTSARSIKVPYVI